MNILWHSVREVDFLLCKQFLIAARWLIPDFRDKGDVNCASSTRFIDASLCKDWRGTITVILHNVFAYLLQICIEKGLWMPELAYLQKVHKSSVWGRTFTCFSSINHARLWCWMGSTLWEEKKWNEIISAHKAIVWFQQAWNIGHKLYGLLLCCFYGAFCHFRAWQSHYH